MKKILLLTALLFSLNCFSQKLSAADSTALDSTRKLLSKALYSNQNIDAAIEKMKATLSFKSYVEAERSIIYFFQMLQQVWLDDKNRLKIK
jgi:hypothetical protein